VQNTLIGRTARLTPASDIIDLTKSDCDAVLSGILQAPNPVVQNNPLRPSPFTEEEGKRRLQSLAKQGKLANQAELLYHPGQDSGVITPKLQPPTRANHASPIQQLIQDLHRAETTPHVSPFGKIGEKRY
jgi:hypothetical protein